MNVLIAIACIVLGVILTLVAFIAMIYIQLFVLSVKEEIKKNKENSNDESR